MIAIAYASYFGVIVYSDVLRPEDLGVRLDYVGEQVYISHVLPSSPTERAGLKAGDRLTRLGSVQLGSRHDPLPRYPTLRLDRPIPVEWVHDGQAMQSTISVSFGDVGFWSTRPGATLATMRAIQGVMLALGFVIAWKQPGDFAALMGAWLLATLAVYSISLPTRLPAVWRDLPAPLELALWVPYLSSIAAGSIIATFYAVFPKKAPRWRAFLGTVWGLTLPLLAIGALTRYQAMYPPQHASVLLSRDWNTPANVLFVALGAIVMVRNYRRLSSETERRQVRFVLASSCITCLCAGVAATYWRWSSSGDLTGGIFSSRALTVGIAPTVLVPFSFGYAILRHRLFDIRLIVRRGLQYALARRFLLSLIPGIAVIFLIDIVRHPDRPAGVEHLWWYAALLAAGVWIYRRRADWLDALDRHYFREHYSAQKLLRELAEDLQSGGRLDDILPAVVGRIEAALHPHYVALLMRSDDGRFYESIGRRHLGPHPLRFSAGDKAIRLLAVLGRPLVVGAGAPRSVYYQLPDEERRALDDLEVELLVGITGPGDTVEGLMALGMKRSEEPFTTEDLDLLATVALNLKPLLPRSTATEECDTCGASFPTGTGRCATDGTVLVSSDTPLLVGDRYAVERRLGRGGMGTVYAARDLQLNRRVAVKLLKERLESDHAVARCRREARAAAALAHANVVTVHDVGVTADGRPFLVMELLRGHTLRDGFAAGPLPPAQIRRVFGGICAALEAAHAEGLVHGDLKPENVFLVDGSADAAVVKLVDFGISTFVDGRGSSSRSGVLGTPEYAAPEQIRGESASPSWDLWALSVMAFEAAVGVRPIACVSLALAAQASPTDGVWNGPALQRLPPALVRLFGDALSLNPMRRPQTPSAFFDALQRALD